MTFPEREELEGMTRTLPVRFRFRRMAGELLCDLEGHKSAPSLISVARAGAERARRRTVLQTAAERLRCQLFNIAHDHSLVLAQAAPVKA